MPRGTNFDPNEHINNALAALDAQIVELQAKRGQLAAVLGGGKKAKAASPAKVKRPMSDEAKQKIREAQQKRWAETKAKGATKKKK
jgi:glycerate-2-kinase